MRGIAALCVMIEHAGLYSETHAYWLPNSDIAVDFFFILSGFVLAYSYGGKNQLGLGQFMARRFIRLYPMFLAGLVLGGAMLFVATRHGLDTMSPRAAIAGTIVNAFYVPFFNQGTGYFYGPGQLLGGELFPANPSDWSLFFEILINLFFFRLFGLRRKMLALLIGISLLTLVLHAYLLGAAGVQKGLNLEAGWSWPTIMEGFPRVLYGFGLGILIFKLANEPWLAGMGARIGRIPGALYLVLAATLGLFAVPQIPHTTTVYYIFAIGVAAPVLVFLGSALHCRGRAALWTVQLLGWLSYPIYCVHYPVIRAVSFLQAQGWRLPLSSVMTASLASIVLAAVLTLAYDQPMRRILARAIRKPPST
jgi:peptidoglycan/LPS O-acetylase OafA/YrhL